MSDEITDVKLARWSERFFAWLIDFVIITVIYGIAVTAFAGDAEAAMQNDSFADSFAHFIYNSMLFFAYWSMMECLTGQSIGKKVFHLRLVSTDGGAASLKNVLVSSFGKAFLLPFDVVFGWIFTNQDRQRMFNRISDTIVIKMPARYATFEKD